MKYARPKLFTVVIAIAVTAAVAIQNKSAIYKSDFNNPAVVSLATKQNKTLKAVDGASALRNKENSTDITAKANDKSAQKAVSIEDNKNPPEPSKENANMLATGEFADQVNFPTQKIECNNACADGSTVNMKATGEFADQINSEEIIAAAKTKGFDSSETKKLVDVPANSAPPTELWVYTPPTDN